jgi:hypothetical protein
MTVKEGKLVSVHIPPALSVLPMALMLVIALCLVDD